MHDGLITDVNSFVSDYQLECSRALERVRLGVPATVLHRSGDTMGEAVHVAETVRVDAFLFCCWGLTRLARRGRSNTSSRQWMR